MENNKEMLENEILPPINGDDSEAVAAYIAEVLDSKKARDIQVLEVGSKTIIAERFVLCTGNSNTQVRALTDEVDYKLELRGIKTYRIEGRDSNAWVIIDYGNVLVHIFSREARQFYNLEKLYEKE